MKCWVFLITILIMGTPRLGHAQIKLEKLEKSDWTVVQSPNFFVITEAKEKLARKIASDLEDFRYFVQIRTGLKPRPANGRLFVIAVSKKSNLKAFGLPEYWQGLYSNKGRFNFSLVDATEYSAKKGAFSVSNHVLMHEYVHNILDEAGLGHVLPIWYNEGFAEYLATFRVMDDEVWLGHPGQIQFRFFDLLPPSTFTRFGIERYIETGGAKTYLDGIESEDLFKTVDLRLDWSDEPNTSKRNEGEYQLSRFYARAVAVVHYLNSTKAGQSALDRYLSLSVTETVDDAFEKSFAGVVADSFEELDAKVEAYINQKALNGWVYKRGEGGVVFPDTASNINPLKRNELSLFLAQTLNLINYYSDDEKIEFLNMALSRNPESSILLDLKTQD
jgi:hypothetical protein